YGIPVLQQYGMNLDEVARTKAQVAAAQCLFSIIVGSAEQSTKFTEIFRTAPVWLLNFTRTFIDASFLNFHLPGESERSKWGSAGREASWRWPLLPLGMMTDGDLLSDEEAKLWPIELKMKEQVDFVPSFDGS